MPSSAWVTVSIVAALVVVLGVLDGYRRQQQRNLEAKLSPEQRAIRQRERKVFANLFRRGR